MRISGTLDNYSSAYSTQTINNKKEYNTVNDYQKALRDKYACLKGGNSYSVDINKSLLSRGMSDPKTAEWLEHNLALIPKGIDSLNSSVAANGGKVMSCKVSIDGYDSISTEVHAVFESDTGDEDRRKVTEESIQKRRAEKKAAEKRAEDKEVLEQMLEVSPEMKLEMEEILLMSNHFDTRV